MTNLLTFYEGWDNHQRLLVAMIKPLTMDQLALRPAPHMWSLYTLAAHIISTRIWWFHNWMGEGTAELEHALDWDEEGQPIRPADELIDMLNQSWAMIETLLSHWTEADLGQSFKNPLYKDRPDRTRQWIIWHVLEHDIHHSGEISQLLGSNGLTGIDL